MDDWGELDGAAKVNLNSQQLSEFYRYKAQLKRENHKWMNDARDILIGFIWDESEDTYKKENL